MRRLGSSTVLGACLVVLHAVAAYPQDKPTFYTYWFSPDRLERAWITSEGYEAEGATVLVFSRINNDSTRRLTYLRELYDCAGERVAVEIRREADLVSKKWVFDHESDNPVAELKPIKKGSRESFMFPGVCSYIGPRARSWTEAENYFAEFSKELEKSLAR